MYRVTITASALGEIAIQDPFPAEGILVGKIPASQTKVFSLTDGQYNHLRPILDKLVTAGKITTLLVNETEEERSNKWNEIAEAAAPLVRAGFGKYYTGLDKKPHFLASDGTDYNLGLAGSSPVVYKGGIAAAAGFPLAAVVLAGWEYNVTAPCSDNAGPPHTNTGQSFLRDDEIRWNGVDWTLLGSARKQTVVTPAMSPYAVTDADEFILVDTTGAGPVIRVDLPSPVGRKNKKYELLDYGNNCNIRNIVITVLGVPLATMDVDGMFVATISDDVAWIPAANMAEEGQNTLHRRGAGADHSDVGLANTHRTSAGTDHSDVGLANTHRTSAGTDHSDVGLANTHRSSAGTDHSDVGLANTHRTGNGEDHSTVDACRLGHQTLEDFQGAAATVTTRVFRARVAGSIQRFAAETGVVAAVGESMTFDILVSGVSVLTAPVLIDSTVAIDTPVAGVIVAAPGNAYAAGDLITIVRTYVAGGGPTMANTVATSLVRSE